MRAFEDKSGKKMFAYGAVSVGLGLLVILSELWADEHFGVSQHSVWVGLKLIDEIGIALVTIGAIGIILEFRNWNTYFQERIAETILQQRYLKTLDPEQLIQLQTNTLKAFFKIDDIDRQDSFLQFFHERIHKYIASPYREEVRDVVDLQYSSDRQLFEITETLSFKCRKVGDNIQENVHWVNTEETHIEAIALEVQIQIPQNFFQSPEFRTKYPKVADRCVTFKSSDTTDGRLTVHPKRLGYTLSLEDYREIDGLFVKMRLKYTMPVNWPLTWIMSHPTRTLTGTLSYPDDLEIAINVFGMEEAEVDKDLKPGLCVIAYDSWLLPNTGFSFDFVQPKTRPLAAPGN